MLTGEAKRNYQREYMKKWRSNQHCIKPNRSPSSNPLIPSGRSNKTEGLTEGLTVVPLYNPTIHKTGDHVKIWSNGRQVEIILP